MSRYHGLLLFNFYLNHYLDGPIIWIIYRVYAVYYVLLMGIT